MAGKTSPRVVEKCSLSLNRSIAVSNSCLEWLRNGSTSFVATLNSSNCKVSAAVFFPKDVFIFFVLIGQETSVHLNNF